MAEATALIIRAAGTNCDVELADAFRLAGARPLLHHLHTLTAEPSLLADADILAFPGGFTYGDDVAAGRLLASRLGADTPLGQALRQRVADGVPVLGICNGFQVLVKAGLLPDPQEGRQTVSLVETSRGRFDDRWIGVRVPPGARCIWTRGLPERFDLPVANAEGRFVAPPEVLHRLQDRGQVALTYAGGEAANGSAGGVAGLCDPTGLVFGLMPHPERAVRARQLPGFSAGSDLVEDQAEGLPGLAMLKAAVAYARGQAGARAGASA